MTGMAFKASSFNLFGRCKNTVQFATTIGVCSVAVFSDMQFDNRRIQRNRRLDLAGFGLDE